MRIEKEKTCCFTGYRPGKLPWKDDEADERCVNLKQRIAEAAEDAYARGFRHFICGMALGCDTYFCETILEMKRRYGDIVLEAAIPCEEQPARWAERERNRYFRLVSRCDIETMVQTNYSPNCMMRRNRYMVDCSKLLIAVYDGLFGGTMHTLEYAMRQKLSIVLLSPVED